MGVKLDKTEIIVVITCCVGLLASAVFIILALVYYTHRRSCMYSIEIPCYTDWRCPSTFKDKNNPTSAPISDGVDNYVTSGGQYYYPYTHHFGNYYKQCLGHKGGNCSAGAAGEFTSSAPNTLSSCSNIDINDYGNFNGSFPYGSSNLFTTQPYPEDFINPDKQTSKSRNACLNLGSPKTSTI